jgi:hypothetical protein
MEPLQVEHLTVFNPVEELMALIVNRVSQKLGKTL